MEPQNSIAPARITFCGPTPNATACTIVVAPPEPKAATGPPRSTYAAIPAYQTRFAFMRFESIRTADLSYEPQELRLPGGYVSRVD